MVLPSFGHHALPSKPVQIVCLLGVVASCKLGGSSRRIKRPRQLRHTCCAWCVCWGFDCNTRSTASHGGHAQQLVIEGCPSFPYWLQPAGIRATEGGPRLYMAQQQGAIALKDLLYSLYLSTCVACMLLSASHCNSASKQVHTVCLGVVGGDGFRLGREFQT